MNHLACNSPGARGPMTSNLVPKVNIFGRCLLWTSAEDEYTQSLCFLAMTWPWKKWLQHGSTWSFRLSLKKQVSPGGLPIDETGNDLHLTSSPQRIVVVTRSDQRILTVEYFIVDNISSGKRKKEVLEAIPPPKVSKNSCLLKNPS